MYGRVVFSGFFRILFPGCEKHFSFLSAIIIGTGDFIPPLFQPLSLAQGNISDYMHIEYKVYGIAHSATQHALRARCYASILATRMNFVVDTRYIDAVILFKKCLQISFLRFG